MREAIDSAITTCSSGELNYTTAQTIIDTLTNTYTTLYETFKQIAAILKSTQKKASKKQAIQKLYALHFTARKELAENREDTLARVRFVDKALNSEHPALDTSSDVYERIQEANQRNKDWLCRHLSQLQNTLKELNELLLIK